MNIKKHCALLVALANTCSAVIYNSVDFLINLSEDEFPISDSSYWDYPIFNGESTVLVENGNLSYSRFITRDNSSLEIAGGSIDGNIQIEDSSRGVISGGESEFSIASYGTSTLEIKSGSLRIATAYDNSSISFHSGDVSLAISLQDNSQLTLHGSDIEYNFFQYSSTWGRNEYTLSGFDVNGNWYETSLYIYDNFVGDIKIQNVPEPGSYSILIGTFVFFSTALRRKHNPKF
ncbi:hypothetical protein [Coraliomargarita akajimensis]|uniref:PEP-CTERM protein-sorting domain-containing protein n=1 Tax=Coraliomargarita akajimensis (strain DSM 45221 / IAM 15411 / JCM 23193 / KCTC 12865 / 04OKA010-24) TaxID=583355 RepID=D5ENU3_CORAD|nr:hypothetical protein [Coraliomargarita akajimensis]ADE53602.1 hypothetical protein Caka_0577 [Coraliomargarita akajimensis DSM 45221]